MVLKSANGTFVRSQALPLSPAWWFHPSEGNHWGLLSAPPDWLHPETVNDKRSLLSVKPFKLCIKRRLKPKMSHKSAPMCMCYTWAVVTEQTTSPRCALIILSYAEMTSPVKVRRPLSAKTSAKSIFNRPQFTASAFKPPAGEKSNTTRFYELIHMQKCTRVKPLIYISNTLPWDCYNCFPWDHD